MNIKELEKKNKKHKKLDYIDRSRLKDSLFYLMLGIIIPIVYFKFGLNGLLHAIFWVVSCGILLWAVYHFITIPLLDVSLSLFTLYKKYQVKGLIDYPSEFTLETYIEYLRENVRYYGKEKYFTGFSYTTKLFDAGLFFNREQEDNVKNTLRKFLMERYPNNLRYFVYFRYGDDTPYKITEEDSTLAIYIYLRRK